MAAEKPKLIVENREEMSLLGLMLGGVLERSLERPDCARRARRLKGDLGVTAGKMSISLRFDRGEIRLVRGLPERPRARVRGSLDSLLQVSLGRGAVRAFLAGEVSFRGNPLFVLSVLPLMRVEPDKRGRKS
jgi:hypothetical protein